MDVFPFSETCSLIGFVPRVNNGPLIRLVSSTSLTKQYNFITAIFPKAWRVGITLVFSPYVGLRPASTVHPKKYQVLMDTFFMAWLINF